MPWASSPSFYERVWEIRLSSPADWRTPSRQNLVLVMLLLVLGLDFGFLAGYPGYLSRYLFLVL